MYPLKHIYSLKAYREWEKWETSKEKSELKEFQRSSEQVSDNSFWEVKDWNQLRTAVSFLMLMNKRHVLYFRGQKEHYQKCLPTLFRDTWSFDGKTYPINKNNRIKYYSKLLDFREPVLDIVEKIGTPRSYILKHVPAAAAAILQHYELWPTHFIDITRSLNIAVAFSEGHKIGNYAYLYVFALPDLRGSITSDIDQHISIARLEAICPPAAMRPHHQDAYLVSRFPEPPVLNGNIDQTWNSWIKNTDLTKRLVAKFRLKMKNGKFPGAPKIDLNYLIPPEREDTFGRTLKQSLLPQIEKYLKDIQ